MALHLSRRSQILLFLHSCLLCIVVHSSRIKYEPYSLIQDTSLVAFFPLDDDESISNIAPSYNISQPG